MNTDFTNLTDLAAVRLGGKALAANDEFFAPRRNLLQPGRGIFVPDKYTARGKWMDGWETRRRREPGHDWCVVRLGLRGLVRGVDVDTNHFVGNAPEAVTIDALDVPATTSVKSLLRKSWTPILARRSLRDGSRNLFEVAEQGPWSHVRLNIHPDGGVARFRVHGIVSVDWDAVKKGGRAVDLASVRSGGLVLAASDEHFGARGNLIMPGPAANMGDGWETRRRRGAGHDWAIVQLGAPGRLDRVEIDTKHFKGNYPDTASLDACLSPGASPRGLQGNAVRWVEILPPAKLRPDHRHVFRQLVERGPFSHLRLRIYPDGGVSRLKAHGRPE